MEFYKWEGRDVSSAASKGYSWVCSLMAQVSRRTGTVKWFSQQKGFGFITPDAGGDDLFVHQTSIQSDGYRSLSEGEAVEFSVDSGNSGRTKAVDVTGPNGSALAGGGGGGRGYSGVRDRGGSYTGNFGWGKSGGRTYGGGNAGGGSCYNCGKFGHMARDCQEAGRGGGGGGGGRYGGGRYGGGGNGGGGCYNCGEQGHFARECPNGDSK